jgi:hypothetical protein
MKPTDQQNRSEPTGGQIIEIHVRGHLDHYWTDWFDGLEARLLPTGETVLTGPVADQAALIGLLNKLSRLNLTIVSVGEVPSTRGGSLLGPPPDPKDEGPPERAP